MNNSLWPCLRHWFLRYNTLHTSQKFKKKKIGVHKIKNVCASKVTIKKVKRGFRGGAVVKNPPASAGGAGDLGSVPGLGRSPGEGNDNPLQYSHL